MQQLNLSRRGGGGEYGTAQPEHILEGYTIGTDEGIKEGTIINYEFVSDILLISDGMIPEFGLPYGFVEGGLIQAKINPSKANIIKKDDVLGGVTGTYDPPTVPTGFYFNTGEDAFTSMSSEEELVAEVKAHFSGSYRVSFDLMGQGEQDMTYPNALIKVNNVQKGNIYPQFFINQWETFETTLVNINYEDVIQLFIYLDGYGEVYAKNFKVEKI